MKTKQSRTSYPSFPGRAHESGCNCPNCIREFEFDLDPELELDAFETDLGTPEWEDLEWNHERRRRQFAMARHRVKSIPRRPALMPRHPIQRPRVTHRPLACTCPVHRTEFVRWVQNMLNQILGLRLPVTGMMSQVTRDALRNFQERHGLEPDCIVGPDTERALLDARGVAGNDADAPDATAQELSSDELKWLDLELLEDEVARTDRAYVRWVQQALNRVIGARLAVDGVIGPQTKGAIRRFQGTFALSVDGRVRPYTEAMLITLSATLPPGIPTLAPPSGPAPVRPWRTFQLTHFGSNDADLTPEHIARIVNKIAPFIMQHKDALTRVEVIGFATGTTRTSRNMSTARERAVNARRTLMEKLRGGWRATSSTLVKIELAPSHRFIPAPASSAPEPAHRKVSFQVFLAP